MNLVLIDEFKKLITENKERRFGERCWELAQLHHSQSSGRALAQQLTMPSRVIHLARARWLSNARGRAPSHILDQDAALFARLPAQPAPSASALSIRIYVTACSMSYGVNTRREGATTATSGVERRHLHGRSRDVVNRPIPTLGSAAD